ncbi:MAG: hypothetical protein A2252_09545 [Elusimicrobia bacterium RIFOXYA2_FULL_39_19]|nr:MAG: hypothetical protein A2252_09545 [Elusimicrobia bacterium RIFOXYA2_FULL_39_19]
MCKSQFEYNLGTGETQDLKPGSSWPYCPNASCLDHNKSNKGNIIKASNYGKNKKKLRWKCKTCGKTFSDTHSSKVYRKKLSPRKIYRIVQMRSKKHSIREIASRLKINKNTVQHYLKEYEKGDHYGQATIA